MTALHVDPESVSTLADLLGAHDLSLDEGDPLPILWHWVALARWRPWADLGADGHADDGTLPTRPDLPRRMFAGGEVVVHRPLRVGERVRREEEVTRVRDTEGRTGPLRFVRLRLTVTGDDGGLVHEQQDVVYRAAPSRPATGAASAATPGPAGTEPVGLDTHRWTFRADSALLMRFSAITRNTHRIHYDREWATAAEGYPDLVVHGPLLAIVLAERARREGGGVRHVHHRGLAPLFCGHPARLEHRPSTDGRAVVLRSGDTDHSELTVHHLEESP